MASLANPSAASRTILARMTSRYGDVYLRALAASSSRSALPILALDMYEHSYQMDYGAAAAKYVDAFMQNVNWEEVNRRYVRSQKAATALRA